MLWLRALLAVAFGLAVLVWLIPAAPLTGDGQHYIAFVRNNLQHGASSWHERRILAPLLVHALPVDPQTGFLFLTLASLTATALLTWLAARAVVPNEGQALLAIPLLFGTWVVAPNLREYALVDPFAWLFVAAAWLLTVRRRWLAAAVVAAVGVLAKEVVVLAAVAAAASAWAAGRQRLAVVLALPALLVAIGLIVAKPGSGTDAPAYLFGWVRQGLFSNGVGQAVFLTFAAYGALWLLAPAGWTAVPRHVRGGVAAFLLAAPVLPLIGSPERMEELIFPAVVTLAVLALSRVPIGWAWTLALGNVLFAARVGGDARIPSLLAWSGLAIACALAVGIYLPRARLARWRPRASR